VTSSSHNSAMITDHRKFTTKITPLWDFWFPFLPLESIQTHSSGLYTPYTECIPNSLRYWTLAHNAMMVWAWAWPGDVIRSFNKITGNWVSALYGPYSDMNFATKDQFCLNSLLYCKVGQNSISD